MCETGQWKVHVELSQAQGHQKSQIPGFVPFNVIAHSAQELLHNNNEEGVKSLRVK